MSDISRPTPVHPWPVSPEREAVIRAAKAQLNSPQKIRLVEATYGVPGRVLAFERPNFLCNYAPIRPENVDSVESVAAALQFILDEIPAEPDPRWGSEELLSVWMGGPVAYSHSEDITGKMVFS